MGDDKDRTVWVGNLSDKTTDDILYELFLQAGPLNKVTIAKDKSGRPRGYAFIDFKHECSVPYTIQLMEGIELYGKPLKLQARTGSSQSQSPAHGGSPYSYNSPQMNADSGHFKSPPFHRSNTWHGKDLSDSGWQSSQGQRAYADNQYSPSASPGQMRPPQGTWFSDNKSPETSSHRSRDSSDSQRQRVLQSQNIMLDTHRQRDYRHQPYNSSDRRQYSQEQYSRRRY